MAFTLTYSTAFRRLSVLPIAALLGALGLATLSTTVLHADSPASAASATPAAQDAALVPYDKWEIQSTREGKYGWSHETLKQQADGNWVMISSSYSKKSKDSTITIRERTSRTVETPGHKLLSITTTTTTVTDKFKQNEERSLVFKDDGIEMTVLSSGRERKQKLSLPTGEWLSPLGLEVRTRSLVTKGEKNFELPVFNLNVGTQVFKNIYSCEGEEEIEVSGAKVKAVKYKVLCSIAPGLEIWEWFDAQGRSVRNGMSLAGIQHISTLATEAEAKKDFQPSETSSDSVVDCDPPAPARVQRQHKTVWELHYSKEAGVAPPSIGQHKVEAIAPGHVRVTIDLNASDTENQFFKPIDKDLGTSTMCDWKDDAIMDLAKQIQAGVDPGASQEKIAKSTTRFVTRYMKPSHGVGSGTASEVARAKTGDCSEYAVLTVALLRAQGIPARQVMGMSYVGAEGFIGHSNCFVYHAWALAWLKNEKGEGRWVNCDAAPGNRQITRIILGTSDLNDVTSQNDLLKLLPLMQGMKAEYKGGDAPPATPATRGKQVQ